MAKTESTAVNALIDQVNSGKPQAAEPGADLFSAPKSTSVHPPRMTTPIPPMRGAGEVAPLPRGRSPRATSQNAMPALPPQVRMSTADPSRGNTIPPLSRPTSKPGAPTQRASAPLPAPRNTPRSTGQVPTQRPSTLPPKIAPVAAPFEARVPSLPALPGGYPVVKREPTVDVTGDVVKADNWFDVSAAVHKLDPADGTHIVPRPHRDTLSLVKKMIAPTIILAIIGVMIGGFFAFNGDGGKKKPTPSAAPAAAAVAPQAETRVAMTAAPNVPASPESPNAATASAGGAQPEPPTKAEDLAKQEAAAAETAKQEAAKSDSMFPAATTAVITHDAPAAAKAPAPAEAPKAEAPKAEAPKAEAPKAEAPKAVAATPTPSAPAGAEVVAVKALKTSNEPALVREVRTARGVVKLVDVRIDSKPSGATVTLVDAGKTSFLGTTPLATSLDPSRKYDVIFSLAGRPTQMAPLDPSATSKLDVTLGRAHHSSSAAKKEAPAPKLDSFLEKPAPKADAKEAKVEKPAPKAEAKVEKKSAEPAGEGTLMVSSKPPCEIVIDGKPTGMMTPQRAIALAAGTHKITFVNDAEGIKKTVSVSITADQSTKLIQDLMKK